MNWRIVYTENAAKDLEDIYNYIRWELLAPDAAFGQVERIEAAILRLDDYPNKHPVYPHEPWHSRGVRYRVVDHYIVFYYPDEPERRVIILRIMYYRQKNPRT